MVKNTLSRAPFYKATQPFTGPRNGHSDDHRTLRLKVRWTGMIEVGKDGRRDTPNCVWVAYAEH